METWIKFAIIHAGQSQKQGNSWYFNSFGLGEKWHVFMKL